MAQIAQKFAFLHFFKNHPFCGAFYCFVAPLTFGPLTSADRVRSENIVFVKPRCKVVAKSPESDEQMFHKCSLAVSMSQSDLRKFISNPSDHQNVTRATQMQSPMNVLPLAASVSASQMVLGPATSPRGRPQPPPPASTSPRPRRTHSRLGLSVKPRL